jgi:hypothetical protein
MKSVLSLLVFAVLHGWLAGDFSSQGSVNGQPDWRWGACAVVAVGLFQTRRNHGRLSLNGRQFVGQAATLVCAIVFAYYLGTLF